MGVFSALAYRALTPSPVADFWYQPIASSANTAGIRVTQETALCLSAVWRCTAIIAGSVAMLPLKIYRALPDGGKEEARRHPLWDVLHDQPNRQHTSYVFREILQTHALLRGNAFARILPGPRGVVDQLVPLHPDNVRVDVLPTGVVRYVVRRSDGTQEALSDDEIFHLPGLSDDGVSGLSVISYAAQSLGIALAQREWGASFYRQAPRPGGIAEHPAKLSGDAQKRLRQQLKDVYGGGSKVGEIMILEEGMKWHGMDTGITAEDAAYVAAVSASVQDIARWFGIPNHMLGETTKETSWGSGIEQIGIGFVTYTLMHWLKRWEAAIKKDLIVASQTYFAEFELDALLRGDTKSRYEAYQVAAGGQAPWMSRNEVRRRENLNPLGGLDEMLAPLNMGTVGEPLPAVGGQSSSRSPAALAYVQALVQDAAARIVRKEMVAMSKAARRCASDTAAWQQAVEEFYANHAAYVAESLHCPETTAHAYVAEQRAALLQRGAAALDDWETRRVEDLVRLVSV